MLRSFQIGKLFGIPLYVHTTFFLLPAWILLANGGIGPLSLLFVLTVLAALFACVVLHELGHALMARYFGIGTESITLYPIGGVARLQRMSDKPFEEICIALAGPAVTLAIVFLLSPLVFAGNLLHPVLSSPEPSLVFLMISLGICLWQSNLGLFLFNLLPCFPMDGGRVLRAILALWKGQLRATEIAVRISLLMAFFIACLSPLLHSPMPLLVAVFVLFAGQMELIGLRQREAQRRAATFAGEEAPQATEPFSGVAWDNESQVWVKWHKGRPIAY